MDYEPDYHDVDTPDNTGYCVDCKRTVDTKQMDFGIGGYEYWGCKGYHTDVRVVCAKCEGDIGHEPESGKEDED